MNWKAFGGINGYMRDVASRAGLILHLFRPATRDHVAICSKEGWRPDPIHNNSQEVFPRPFSFELFLIALLQLYRRAWRCHGPRFLPCSQDPWT